MTSDHKIIQPADHVRGQITLPGDKSLSHRAVIFASVAKGHSKIKHLNNGADVLSTIACFQKLGVNFQLGKFTVSVDSPGIFNWQQPEDGVLNCGNSGTTVRLLAGLLAGRKNLDISFTGDESLSSRPMNRIIDPLVKMDAQIASAEGQLPLQLKGSDIHSIEYALPVASAQVKSCVLFAGLSAKGKTIVKESIKSRDHTENMMKMFNIPIYKQKGGLSVHTLKRNIPGFDYSVPGDPSSSAYWVAAALMLPKSRLVLKKMSLNPTRIAFIKLLKASGARIEVSSNSNSLEPMGDVVVKSSDMKAFNIKSKQVPALIDEIPILALIATQARGVTEIRGAKELRFKESDRIQTTVDMLKRLGADVEELDDGMRIKGPSALHGAVIHACHDHRIAMTAAIAGLIVDSPVTIDGGSTVDISYPGFYQILSRIGKS